MDTLLIDGITLLGNLGLNDHVKALIRMQKGIELIIDVMTHYGTLFFLAFFSFFLVICSVCLD